MSDDMPPWPGIISALQSALRTLPVWVFAGLAIAGLVILYAPPPSRIAIAFDDFRDAWGAWIWAGTVLCAVLAAARLVDLGIASYANHRVTRQKATLKLFPGDHPRWHLAKQPDGSYVTQIILEINAVNMTDGPIRLMHTRLVRPKVAADLVRIDTSLRNSRMLYSGDHPVPAHQISEAVVHVLVRKALASAGTKLPVVIELTDHRGQKYRVKATLPPKL